MDELIIGLAWPIVVFILILIFILIFKKPIGNMIDRIRVAKGEGKKWEINFDPITDKIVQKPFPQVIQPKGVEAKVLIGEPTISNEKPIAIENKPTLSEKEIEESREKAQKRIDEDTEKVGYVRGKLYRLKDGRYGVAWDLSVSDTVIVSG
jgi:hypothetical protein